MGSLMIIQSKNRKWIYLILYGVSFFFTVDYFILIRSGDDSVRRKIVFTVWFLLSVVWLALFLREVIRRVKAKQAEPDDKV